MKITFKCKASGNTVSFGLVEDIEIMRKNTDYEEVKEEVVEEQEIEVPQGTITIESIKKRGRPAKVR